MSVGSTYLRLSRKRFKKIGRSTRKTSQKAVLKNIANTNNLLNRPNNKTTNNDSQMSQLSKILVIKYFNRHLQFFSINPTPIDTKSQPQMNESYLYERSEEGELTKSPDILERQSSSGNGSKYDLMESVFQIMHQMVCWEERIQIYKQMLTEHTHFSPEPLFYYVSRGQQNIDKKHLIKLFQENQFTASQEYIKLYMSSYGYKEKIDYSAFINMLFPQNADLIKSISVTAIKKYSNFSTVNQQIVCIYLMLVQEQIRLLESLDVLKSELIPRISRKQIKNVMRIIKKNGSCNSLMEIESQSFIKYEQLKGLLKNYVCKVFQYPNSTKASIKNMQQAQINQPKDSLYKFLERNSHTVFRRLSMGKTSFINLEDLEFWLRPWTRQRNSSGIGQESAHYFSNVFTLGDINQIDDFSKVSSGSGLNIPLSLVSN